MKVSLYKEKIIIYLYDKKYFKNDIKTMIINILEDIDKYYKINIKKSYEIKLYENKYYGMILELKYMEKDNYDIVNIKLKVLKDTLFLYQVDDPLDYLDNNIYFYKNKFYINSKNISLKLLENSILIYGKEAYKIIGSAIKI